MSDANRKSFTQQARESMVPDHEKTMGQSIKESLTDAIDRVKGALQPTESKGLPQQAADKLRSEKDHANRQQ